MKRNNLSKIVIPLFISLMILFIYSLIRRYIYGLGAISNLTDDMPWGLWKGLNLFAGVALASGGFVITAVVYVFNLKDFKILVRPVVLTSFLGYLMVILALLIDDGRPWNIFMPLFFWNTKSVMWEVALCVAFYTAVLFLEFLPLVWEKMGFSKAMKLWSCLTPTFVFIGVILSTLHQSSLGTLLIIVPEKIHPLWYSPILPLLFFVSAVALGLCIANIIAFVFSEHFEEDRIRPLTKKIAILSAFVSSFYFLLRIFDILLRGLFKDLFAFNLASILFILEIFVLGLLPTLLLFFKRITEKPKALLLANLSIIFGIICHRVNVSITAFQLQSNVKYFPHFFEIIVSVSIFAIAIYLFVTTIKYLPVFSEKNIEKEY
ncbi:MAG: Ni/Fe-hydrogenase cytochrome b subunit [Acidobacteria bacterium]|nr:Ni/Fe-hydrogenase cytochrome b subunit [Acidobacteriota bacterium]